MSIDNIKEKVENEIMKSILYQLVKDGLILQSEYKNLTK